MFIKVPHALARHNPGDRPTHNVRTAPTPTTEDPSFVPGISQSSQVGQDSQSFSGQSTQNQVQMPGGNLYRNQEVIKVLFAFYIAKLFLVDPLNVSLLQ